MEYSPSPFLTKIPYFSIFFEIQTTRNPQDLSFSIQNQIGQHVNNTQNVVNSDAKILFGPFLYKMLQKSIFRHPNLTGSTPNITHRRNQSWTAIYQVQTTSHSIPQNRIEQIHQFRQIFPKPIYPESDPRANSWQVRYHNQGIEV